MNCKQGDLAVVVRGRYQENLGKIVRCVRLHLDPFHDPDGLELHYPQREPVWVIDRRLHCEALVIVNTPFGEAVAGRVPSTVKMALDSDLRPIRDSDEEDEILRLVGLPTGIPETVK